MMSLTLPVAQLDHFMQRFVPESHEYARTAKSFFVTAHFLAYVLLALLWGALSDRLGRRKPVYLVGQAASAAVCFVFALAVPGLGAAGAAAAAAAAGLLVGGMIIPFAMIVEMFPGELAGTAAGVTNASCFVGGTIFPIVLGWIADATGGFTASFLVAGGVQAVALGFACLTLETGSRARPRV